MLASLTASALAVSAACAPMPGADELIAKPELRWLMLGEMHGTAEMPAAAADLACIAAAKRRTIVVAIEHQVENQPALDAFLTSDGGAAARAAFLRAPMW